VLGSTVRTWFHPSNHGADEHESILNTPRGMRRCFL
jgi:hypothetical protein